MIATPTVASVSEAWVLGLERVVAEPGGRLVHLVSTVTAPGAEIAQVRQVLDTALETAGKQSVDTVTGTIFPSSLYSDPGFDWMPGIAPEKQAELDAAADALYKSYCDMLPLLLTAAGNSRGTYFGRMVSWPGKVADGPNQLADRISALRSEHSAGRQRNNTLDMDIAADSSPPDTPARLVRRGWLDPAEFGHRSAGHGPAVVFQRPGSPREIIAGLGPATSR